MTWLLLYMRCWASKRFALKVSNWRRRRGTLIFPYVQFNFYLNTHPLSLPPALDRHSLTLRVFLREVWFIFTFFFPLPYVWFRFVFFPSNFSVILQVLLILNAETRQRQERAATLTYIGMFSGWDCGGFCPNTEPG